MSYPPGERCAARVLGRARRRTGPVGQILDVDRQAGGRGHPSGHHGRVEFDRSIVDAASQAAGADVEVIGPTRRGELGATFDVRVGGEAAVLKVIANRPDVVDNQHRLLRLVDLLRDRGSPVPEYLGVASTDDVVVTVQRHMAGEMLEPAPARPPTLAFSARSSRCCSPPSNCRLTPVTSQFRPGPHGCSTRSPPVGTATACTKPCIAGQTPARSSSESSPSAATSDTGPFARPTSCTSI